ncbi:cation:proton antiporter [Marinilabiliaceae bacterium JC017]|nr:cation:proton antiporter [Marinilabiliaceae bacterium JC017]
METSSFLYYCAIVSISILTISMIFPLIRLFKGPSLSDRVVALDHVSIIIMSIVLMDIFISRQLIYLDIVLVVAFVLSLGTMIIARFLQKSLKKDD